jgi:hypothetical protein
VRLLAQELLTFPEHLSLLPVFSGVRVPQSSVFYVVSCGSLFVLLSFYFMNVVCVKKEEYIAHKKFHDILLSRI